MLHVRQKELKNLVKLGTAVDITVDDSPLNNEKSWERIACSHGVNGLNGGLIQGDSGKLYAITARSSTLMRYF